MDSAQVLSMARAECGGTLQTECVESQLRSILDADEIQMRVHSLEYTDATVTTVKLVRADPALVLGFAYDKTGTLLADKGRSLFHAELAAYEKVHGRIAGGLVKTMQTMDTDDLLPVGIWLRMFEKHIDKMDLLADPELLAKHLADQEAYVGAVQEDFINVVELLEPGLSEMLHLFPNAPAATGLLTVEQVYLLSDLAEVAVILPIADPSPLGYGDDSYTWVETVQADGLPWNGSGRKVCILEPCRPTNSTYLEIDGYYDSGPNACYDTHSQLVCGVVRNSYPYDPNGVAQGSACYVANFGEWDWPSAPYSELYSLLGPAVDQGCVAGGYPVWTYSSRTDVFIDRYFDYCVKKYPYPVITMAAGNVVNYVVEGEGWNVVTVGSTNDANTANRSDDIMSDYGNCWGSSSLNPTPDPTTWRWDQELPLLVAPGNQIAGAGVIDSGTSFAAPMVAGVATILMEETPDLVSWPEAIRSILMATASTDIDGTFLDSDDCWRYSGGSWYCGGESGFCSLHNNDDRDGAGEVDAFAATYLALDSNRMQADNEPSMFGWQLGSMSRTSDFEGSENNRWYVHDYYIDGNSFGWPVRVVLSWDASATCTDEDDPGSCLWLSHLDFDLDLYVYDTTTGRIVARSYSQSNSYEFVQFVPEADHDYRIAIKMYDYEEDSTYFGLAWSSWPFEDNN